MGGYMPLRNKTMEGPSIMMHDQLNNPEYCQGIYEAAKDVVEYKERVDTLGDLTVKEMNDFFRTLGRRINNLKRALEGKE